MKIVLDSNIIIADFWLKSTGFNILFESAKKGDVNIYIPEIVLDEVVNKYIQRLDESKRSIDSELQTFQKLTRRKDKTPLTQEIVEKSIAEYQKHLRKVIKENSIIVLKYPKTDHKFLAHKALKKLKPFNSNEKGYRDSLIWENIKTLLTDYESAVSQPELVFISNNYKDFATNEYELHSDLIAELENEDFDPKSVIVYPNLSEFNDKQAKLFFDQSQSFEIKLRNNEIWNFDLKSEIKTYLYENFVGSDISQYDSDEIQSEPTVQSFDEDFKLEIVSVKKLNATDYLVDVELVVNTEIEFFIDKRDYWSMDDTEDISIIYPDWNEWVMLASTSLSVELAISLIIDSNLKVKSCQINRINKNYAQQWL